MKKAGKDVLSPEEKVALMHSVESAKCKLVDDKAATIQAHLDGTTHHHTLLKSQMETLIKPLVERTIECVKAALKNAHIDPPQVDQIVLAGGSTKILLVQSRLKEVFKKDLCLELNPDECVAIGAALMAQNLMMDEQKEQDKKEGFVYQEVQALTIALSLVNDAKEVSVCAAHRRGLLQAGTGVGLITLLVSLLCLCGLQDMVPRNSSLPASVKKTFYTSEDYQTGIRFTVVEGQNLVASRNFMLGEFVIDGLQRKRKGEISVEVEIQVSVEGTF